MASGGQVAVTGTGLLGTLGFVSWLIPGFVLGLPGLLILAVVAAQVIGASVFIPITRRSLGGFGFIHRSSPGSEPPP